MEGADQGQIGKLKWAGGSWATGRLSAGSRSAALSEAALWGIDPALLEPKDHEDGVWEIHADALRAFLAVKGQWRVVPGDARFVWLGLDYTAVQAGLDLAGISLSPEQWSDVQSIEAGALEAMNRK